MSSRKSIQEKIQAYIQSLQDLHTDLMKRNEINALDTGLLRKYTLGLYEEIGKLEQAPSREPALTEESPAVSEQVNEPDKPRLFTPEAPAAMEISQPEELPVPEPDAKTETPSEPVLNEAPVGEMEAPVKDLKPEYALQQDEIPDLASKLSNSPIGDLKQAISIAKKFELINSLFGGDVQKYAYTIHLINNMKSGDEAFDHLHQLKAELQWDEEDRNFVELANLVRRRFLE